MTGLSSQYFGYINAIWKDLYPSPGPRNGVRINIVEGTARCAGKNVSLMVPAATAKDGEKQNPAKKRKTQSSAIVRLYPAARVNELPNSTAPR
jgi:hypothetical protein